MKYDIDYFINKFEAIPEDRWTTGNYENAQGQFCALGFCGENEDNKTEESIALCEFTGFADYSIVNINDEDNGTQSLKLGKTPKERILNFLKQKKAGKL
jgi:hypothetical protein